MKVIILAAGKGKRLGSEAFGMPKVMRRANGKPLLQYVLNAVGTPPSDVILVVGYMKDKVINAYPEYVYAVQEPQLGTGHAVMSALPCLQNYEGPVLVTSGDMPMVEAETYNELIRYHLAEHNDATVLTGVFPEIMQFGRIVRDSCGSFERIVEAKDSNPEIDKIREYNTGIYVFEKRAMSAALGELKSDNAQSEYYLTDTPAIIRDQGGKAGICSLELGNQMLGVNTEDDLHLVESIIRARN